MFQFFTILVIIFSLEASHGTPLFCPAGTVKKELSFPSDYLEYAASSKCKNVDNVVQGQIGQMKCDTNQANLFILDPEPCSNFILLEMCFFIRHIDEIRATFSGFFNYTKTFRVREGKIGDPAAWNWVCLDTLDINPANNPLGDSMWNILLNFRKGDQFDKFAVQRLRITACQFFIEDCDDYYYTP